MNLVNFIKQSCQTGEDEGVKKVQKIANVVYEQPLSWWWSSKTLISLISKIVNEIIIFSSVRHGKISQ